MPSKPQATSAGEHNTEPELTITAGYTGLDITSWENGYQPQGRAGQDPDTVHTEPAFISPQTILQILFSCLCLLDRCKCKGLV